MVPRETSTILPKNTASDQRSICIYNPFAYKINSDCANEINNDTLVKEIIIIGLQIMASDILKIISFMHNFSAEPGNYKVF